MNEELKETIDKLANLCAVSANEIGEALKNINNKKDVNMDSKPILAFGGRKQGNGIVWETPKGTVITFSGSIDPQENLQVIDIKTEKEVANIDWRNVLMNILPINKEIKTITITEREYNILRADSEELYYQKYPAKRANNGYQVYLDTLLYEE